MAAQLIWAPSARLDLIGIYKFIAQTDADAALRTIERIFEAAERLPEFPQSGRIVPEFEDSSIREIIQAPFRIVYRCQAKVESIQIVRVWHAARGIPDI